MIVATAYYSINSQKNQVMEKGNKNLPYIWVQISIYKKVDKPLISGDTNRFLIPWKYDKKSQESAAKLFGVTVQTIINWRKRGLIKRYKIGQLVYYKKSELLQTTSINSIMQKI